MRTRLGLLLLLPLTAGACGGDDPQPDAGPPPALAAEGTYAVQSPIELTGAALAPEPVVKAVGGLKALRQNPSEAFAILLDEAGVPLARNLYAALPGALESRLNGWINDAILNRSHEGRSVGEEIDVLVALSEATLFRFDLLTDMTLPAPSSAPGSMAVHTLRGLEFDLLDGRMSVEIPRLVEKHTLARAETQATARIVAPTRGGDADLELGDHAFGIPYGEYALAALDAASVKRWGLPFRPAVGKLVDCPAMAASVAGKCLGPACVGHQSDLLALCERGVDLLVAKVQDSLRAYNWDAVRFKRGRAQLWDAPAAGGAGDGRADRIAAGTWEATIDAGMGPREVRATFTGARR
jgi:hypothetical protein